MANDITNRAFKMFEALKQDLDDYELKYRIEDGTVGGKRVIAKNKYTRKMRLIEIYNNFDITWDVNSMKQIKNEIKYSCLFKQSQLVRTLHFVRRSDNFSFLGYNNYNNTLESAFQLKLNALKFGNILRQTSSCLVFLHKQSLVHRNIKPKHFYLTNAGHIKIGNFFNMVECYHDQTINGHVKTDIWVSFQ